MDYRRMKIRGILSGNVLEICWRIYFQVEKSWKYYFQHISGCQKLWKNIGRYISKWKSHGNIIPDIFPNVGSCGKMLADIYPGGKVLEIFFPTYFQPMKL